MPTKADQAAFARITAMWGKGQIFLKRMPDGSIAGVARFAFTFGICSQMGECGYRDRWCYEHAEDAALAFHVWDGRGDPPGPWIKHKGVGYDRYNPLLFEHVEHEIYRRRLPEEIDMERIWPAKELADG